MPRRLLPFCLTAFLLAGCGGGGDDGSGGPPTGPPPNQAPTADLSATADEGLESLETTVELTCSDPDGSVAEYRMDTDGDGSFEVTASSTITETLTVEQNVTVGGQCTDDDGADSPVAEVSLSVLEPATVTVHLRNLTQEGEPFVRGEGEITFVVGDDTLASEDSVVVEGLDPREGVEVWATHPTFYDPWGIVKDDGQPKFEHLAHRDVEKTTSTVSLSEGETLRLFVYKIRRDDIEEAEDARGDRRFTIADVATIIDGENAPPDGTERYIAREIPIWINEAQSDSVPEGSIDAIRHWASTDNRREGAKGLTDGYVQSMPVQVGGQEPEGPHYEVRFVNRNTHVESTVDSEIVKSTIRLESDSPLGWPKGQGPLVGEFTQGLGLRSDIGGSLGDDILRRSEKEDVHTEYNNFGLRLGKILYWFPPGTHFRQE